MITSFFRRPKRVRNERGTSMVSVLVFAAAGMVVGASLLSMNFQILRLQKQIQGKGELMSWELLAGQYLQQKGSGSSAALCDSFVSQPLPSEQEICGWLLDAGGQSVCQDLSGAPFANVARQGCSSDPRAESGMCPDLFLNRAFPGVPAPLPKGFTGQQMRVVLPGIFRGPGYDEARPEYLLPVQLTVLDPNGAPRLLEPGYLKLGLTGEDRTVESCDFGRQVVSSAGQGVRDFDCQPGQVLVGFLEGQPVCSPDEPCVEGQSLVREGEAWACAESPDEGAVTLCLGDCL